MELSSWTERQGGTSLYCNKKETLQIIQSLTNQLVSNDPNVGRKEFWIDKAGKREYFTIFVVDKE